MFLELTLCCKMSFIKEPLNLLSKNLNLHIIVVLKDGSEYRCKIIGCDRVMNIVLEGAVEIVDGQPIRNYGRVLLRGNNIMYVILGEV